MTDKDMAQADFRLFLVLWNQQQNYKTPLLHLKIASWLENRWAIGDKRLLLMAFRSAGKSTLVGIFAAWLLYRDPNLRILVLAADLTLAKKMVRNVKRIIERHPLTSVLRPKNADQWASDRFTITRDLELRDPSMIAKGISANITGSRADIVICDDVEVPNTCDSAEKRQNLRERLAEISYVLTAGGTQLYVGTPHDYYSIYADVARHEIGEERPYLDGFTRFTLPILDSEGQSVWPERYTLSDIEQIKTATGPNKFASQMMLKFVNIMEGHLNPDLLQIYNEDLIYDKTLNTLFLGMRKMVGVSAWWDPAFGKAGGDNSVLAIVFSDDDGNYYLHHLEYIRLDEHSEMDEASQQAYIVSEILKRLYVPSIAIEMNGIGRFLPNILRNILVKEHCPARVYECHSNKPKAIRIIEGLDALMAAKRLYVQESVQKTPFFMEMREWRPKTSKGHDDGLDAVAGALSQHPDRLERVYSQGQHRWMRGGKPQMAQSDFKV